MYLWTKMVVGWRKWCVVCSEAKTIKKTSYRTVQILIPHYMLHLASRCITNHKKSHFSEMWTYGYLLWWDWHFDFTKNKCPSWTIKLVSLHLFWSCMLLTINKENTNGQRNTWNSQTRYQIVHWYMVYIILCGLYF